MIPAYFSKKEYEKGVRTEKICNFAAIMKNKQLTYHILAVLTVVIWGTTFVSTKVLLTHNLEPSAIFFLRFLLAYLLLIAFYNKKLWCDNVKDELIIAALGLTGGSAYFLTENMALEHTTATNTSLIVCSCPLFATILFGIFFKERFTRNQIGGGLLAFAGMTVVVLNGRFVLHLSPLGDMLAFAACISWAIYSILIRLLADRYSSLFINRKIFFYGLVTIIPWFAIFPEEIPSVSQILLPPVYLNLLFLGAVASLLCYCIWTICIKKLGVIVATNYVYLNPIATVILASLVLAEQITIWFIAGSALILLGLYVHNKKVRS